ncbi:MAG: arsenate reductase [Patiriisocius sp.]|jgi:arsenate reductase
MNLTSLDYLESLDENHIADERKIQLDGLVDSIKNQISKSGFSKVVFICTHNSRRSTLAQVLCESLANLLDLNDITFYSGGTESTAFNYRMVKALQAKGFVLEEIEKGENPKYILQSDSQKSSIYFSKKYDEEPNPTKDFIAVIVCDHAADNCPIVHGADAIVPLTYIDPKNADDSENEPEVYLKKVDEIGGEMKYMMKRVLL